MKGLLAVAAVAEAATGLALLVLPSMVGELLLGAQLTGEGAALARLAGIALTGLALACWPGPPRLGMLVYSTAVAAWLAYLGLSGAARGTLLWPAVGLHLILSALLARKWRAQGITSN
jgi:hypothetical protein